MYSWRGYALPYFGRRSRQLGRASRPHVTVLHPRSVEASEADWLSYVGREIGAVVTVSEVAVVEFRDERWQTRETVDLAG